MSPEIAICFEALHRRGVTPLRELGDSVPRGIFAADGLKKTAVMLQRENSSTQDSKEESKPS